MTWRHEEYNDHIARIRGTEYPSLLKTTYLDHAGTTVYARSLLDACHEDLSNNLYGNPHSESPASWLATQRVDEARQAVLDYFDASTDDFDVVFCANATAAIKLVADAFREQHFWYGYHKDCHNSVVGVRELAQYAQCFATEEDVQRYMATSYSGLKLFAYPAQSNLTGYRLPYEWTRRFRNCGAYILLDAASYLTSGRLNLSDANTAPDFIAMSFYKIFGYPDLGALIVRRSAFEVLRRRKYFAGGTVEAVTAIGGSRHVKRSCIHECLEDGTLPFHNIIALKHAIDIHKRIFGSVEDISQHTAYLSSWLYEHFVNLKHANGQRVLEIYKDINATYGDPGSQGPILSFSVLRANGTYVGTSHFERLAIKCGLQTRTGGACNPGGVQSSLGLEHWQIMRNYLEGATCGAPFDMVGDKPTGVIRVSLGSMSTLSDVFRLVDFVQTFFVKQTIEAESSAAPRRALGGVENGNLLVVKSPPGYESLTRSWYIVSTSDQRVSRSRMQNLTVEIDIQGEELVFNDTHRMSLWDLPARLEETSTNTKGLYVFYTGEVNQYLTSTLGVACRLARYREEDPTRLSEATTCVVCSSIHENAAVLTEHYSVHALEFLKKHPVGRPKTAGSGRKFGIMSNRSLLNRGSTTAIDCPSKQDSEPSQITIQSFELYPSGNGTKQKEHKSLFVRVRKIMGRI